MSNQYTGRPHVKHQCKQCNAEFSVPAWWPNSKTAKFCSIPCRDAYRRDPARAFWPKVNKDGPIPPHQPQLGPCWIWTGRKTSQGYGRLGERYANIHRLSWQIHNGNIPDGLCVLHRCDNPPCVNPAHLFLGTYTDNARDMVSKGRNRGPRGETHSWAKITEMQAREVILRKERGESLRDVCKALNQPETTIANIYYGHTWKWLPRMKS